MKVQRDPRVFGSDEAGVGMTRQLHGAVLLSVVVPCFNEEDALRSTHARLSSTLAQLPADFEIIYVDDGSTDATPEVLRELQAGDSHIRVVRFSRNFGHQMAITAGLEHAAGDAVVIIDADLQDPPETILTHFSANGRKVTTWCTACAPNVKAKRRSSCGPQDYFIGS